jgi:hypothetical protein
VGFLKAHPTETVYMRVKEEFSPQLNTRSFEATFQSYWNDGRWKDYFWQPGSDNNPTLGSTRGKLVVLQNFDGGKYGIPYSGLDGQDEYNLGTNWDLYWKWEKVRDHLSKANGGPWDTKYINYLSGSGGVFPYFVASGHSSPGTGAPRLATGRTTPGWNSSYPDFPRVDCFIGICTIAFEGTNILTSDRLINYRRVGIIMADFPGPDLINNVIRMTQKQNTRSISFWKGQLPARNGELRDCLGPDQSAFIADNGWYKLAWQGDGNLVMYDREGKPRWASGTNGPDTTGLCFQGDGNLVIYGRSGPKWATGTNPGGNELRFQTDCNLVIYDSTGNPKWHTNTYPCR